MFIFFMTQDVSEMSIYVVGEMLAMFPSSKASGTRIGF